MEVPIPLENKCRITDSLELSCVEEKLGRTRARERFESGALDAMTPEQSKPSGKFTEFSSRIFTTLPVRSAR